MNSSPDKSRLFPILLLVLMSQQFVHEYIRYMSSVSTCVILAVTMNDRGLYSCNLHHHYCQLYETIRVQLNVTKSRM